jgi:cyclopropane-fatty-acyl-phospholipid synthase
MGFTSTTPLCREIARLFPERPFTIDFWDGGTVPATGAGGPTFRVRSPRALAQALSAPGQLGLSRAYVSGELEVEDLDGVIDIWYQWTPPTLRAWDRFRLSLAAVCASGGTMPPSAPLAELRPLGMRRSKARDARAVRHHYDVSNDFFALFLDPSMTYSCAFFSRNGESLESAQQAKLELTCRKLGLQPGQRLLDIGCGWGSFAIHAASRHGVDVLGITLSEPQAALARARVSEAGLENRVRILVLDYRDLTGEQFDAIASIGMVEHVGAERIDLYAERLAGLVRPGGRLLNHGVARLHYAYLHTGAFSERYVFPDADPLHLSRVILALERAGFVTQHVEAFAADYAETLRHWARRLDEHRAEAVRLVGEERLRVWRLYLRGCRAGFESGFMSVYQVQCGLAETPSLSSRADAQAPISVSRKSHARRPPAHPAGVAASPASP